MTSSPSRETYPTVWIAMRKKWIHYGLTSTDVVDTANGVILKKVNKILLEDIKAFMAVLKDKAFQYQNTICVGEHRDSRRLDILWFKVCTMV